MTTAEWVGVGVLTWAGATLCVMALMQVNRRSARNERSAVMAETEELVADKDGIVIEHLTFTPSNVTSEAGSVTIDEEPPEGGTLVIIADLRPHQRVRVTVER